MPSRKTKIAMEVGAGIIAAGAAAAAGYYFFAGKNAEKNRRKVASWALGLKRDIEKQIKNLKSIEQAAVLNVIEKVAKGYERAEGVSMKDLAEAVTELKSNWRRLTGGRSESEKSNGRKTRSASSRRSKSKSSENKSEKSGGSNERSSKSDSEKE